MLRRPDLADLPEDVVAYIEALEARLEMAQEADALSDDTAYAESDEEPTTINIITISAGGVAKRTPRHLYARQRRGGMGIFDLDSREDDPPRFLVTADISESVILLTNHGRAFRAAVQEIVETPIRGRGLPLLAGVTLRGDERIALAFGDRGGSYLALVSERGQVRRIGSQYLGKALQPGTVLHDPKDGGAPAAACWTSGNDELLIVTRQGRAIRFAERLVPVRGCLGMRVEPDDRVTCAAAAPPAGSVFLLTEDGKGTVRLLDGFAANKSPGSSGKQLMKTEALIGALAVTDAHDLFVISRLGKLIRFRTGDVPAKEGVVQGVHCMNLRADNCVALTGSAIGG